LTTAGAEEMTGREVSEALSSSSLGGLIHLISLCPSSVGRDSLVGVVEPCFEFESLSFGGEKNDIEVMSQAAHPGSGFVLAHVALMKSLTISRWGVIGAVDLLVVVVVVIWRYVRSVCFL
jgi:hypothetical protein